MKIFGKQFHEDHLGGRFLLGYFGRQFGEDISEAIL